MVEIVIEEDRLSPALVRLSEALSDLRPFYESAGQIILNSIKERFAAGVSPDGAPWASKSPVTIRRYNSMTPRHLDVRPLFGPSGQLHESIHYEVTSDGVSWSPGEQTADYAAVMQFGAAKGAFGRTKFNGPIPWGNIPARPYLGFSEQDVAFLLEELEEQLREALKNG